MKFLWSRDLPFVDVIYLDQSPGFFRTKSRKNDPYPLFAKCPHWLNSPSSVGHTFH